MKDISFVEFCEKYMLDKDGAPMQFSEAHKMLAGLLDRGKMTPEEYAALGRRHERRSRAWWTGYVSAVGWLQSRDPELTVGFADEELAKIGLKGAKAGMDAAKTRPRSGMSSLKARQAGSLRSSV